jgi:hypothetical protein
MSKHASLIWFLEDLEQENQGRLEKGPIRGRGEVLIALLYDRPSGAKISPTMLVVRHCFQQAAP